MNKKLLAIACAILIVSASVAWAQRSQEPTTPAVIAVKFHADWCGSCKAMGSVFEELQAKFDTQPVLYVVLDHTRDFNRQQSEYLAASLDLDDMWAQHGNKTGFILLLDGKTHEVLDKLTPDHDLKQMGAALTEAVGKSSANS